MMNILRNYQTVVFYAYHQNFTFCQIPFIFKYTFKFIYLYMIYKINYNPKYFDPKRVLYYESFTKLT